MYFWIHTMMQRTAEEDLICSTIVNCSFKAAEARASTTVHDCPIIGYNLLFAAVRMNINIVEMWES